MYQRLLGADVSSRQPFKELKDMLTFAYPPAFVDALAWALAAEIATPLSAKPELGLNAKKQYEEAIERAGATQWRQGQEYPELDCSLISGRR